MSTNLINVSKMKPFRFFCQKVIPLVFDDSLSYYELLCKVVQQLNEVITALNNNAEAVEELQELYRVMLADFTALRDEWEQLKEDLPDDIEEILDNKIASEDFQNMLNALIDAKIILARGLKIIEVENYGASYNEQALEEINSLDVGQPFILKIRRNTASAYEYKIMSYSSNITNDRVYRNINHIVSRDIVTDNDGRYGRYVCSNELTLLTTNNEGSDYTIFVSQFSSSNVSCHLELDIDSSEELEETELSEDNYKTLRDVADYINNYNTVSSLNLTTNVDEKIYDLKLEEHSETEDFDNTYVFSAYNIVNENGTIKLLKIILEINFNDNEHTHSGSVRIEEITTYDKDKIDELIAGGGGETPSYIRNETIDGTNKKVDYFSAFYCSMTFQSYTSGTDEFGKKLKNLINKILPKVDSTNSEENLIIEAWDNNKQRIKTEFDLKSIKSKTTSLYPLTTYEMSNGNIYRSQPTCNISYSENDVSSITINNLTYNALRTLGTQNNDSYTPTNNYHPATKKYVDDHSAPSGVVPEFVLNYYSTTNRQTDFSFFKSVYDYCNDKNLTELTTGLIFNGTSHTDNIIGVGSVLFTKYIGGTITYSIVLYLDKSFRGNDRQYYQPGSSFTFTFNSSDYTTDSSGHITFTKEYWTPSIDNLLLSRNNEESYTPTNNYNPATKKYVDDKFNLEDLSSNIVFTGAVASAIKSKRLYRVGKVLYLHLQYVDSDATGNVSFEINAPGRIWDFTYKLHKINGSVSGTEGYNTSTHQWHCEYTARPNENNKIDFETELITGIVTD